MIALTLGVWCAALGSAGGLSYELSRPLPSADETSRPAVQANLGPTAIAEQVSELSPVLYIPTITVVGKLAHRAIVAPEPKPLDLCHMRCADWRELDMGSGQVEVCN